MNIKSYFAALVLFSAFALRAAFDQGGVSLDFSSIREEKIDKGGENLITPSLSLNDTDDRWGWKSGYNFQGVTDDERYELKYRGRPYFHTSVGKTLKITTDEKAAMFVNAKTGEPTMTNALFRCLPISRPGNYIIEFQVRGNNAKGPGYCAGLYTCSVLNDKNVRTSSGHRDGKIALSQEYAKQKIRVKIPDDGKMLQIAFYIYGIGEMEIKDLSLYSVTVEEELQIKLHPQTSFGNIYYAPSRRPSFLYFMQNNNQKITVKDPELHLRLPEGVQCLGASFNLGYTPEKKGNEFIFSMKNSTIQENDYWTGPVVIFSDTEPSEKKLPVEYWVSNAGKAGKHHTFDLVIVPAISSVQPKTFYAGMKSVALDRTSDELTKTIAEYYKTCGFNIFCGPSQTDTTKEIYREAGITTGWWPTNPGPNDGYDMGDKNKPEAYRYQLIDGSYLKARRNGWLICPEEAASNGEHFRSTVTEKLQKIVIDKGYKFFMSNWEPLDAFKGCWCERCREAFIRDSGLPADEVRAAWPKEVLAKWREQWLDFRARQHGRMLKNVNDAVKAAGTDSFFVPDLTSDCLWETTWQLFRQYASPEFIDKLDYINAWGPYVYYDINEPFVQQTGVMLKTFFNARMVQEFIAKRIPDPMKRPRLFSYPQQLQCLTWCTFPEATAMEAMSQYLCGWKGYLMYFFPMGCDYRLFRAMIEVNQAIVETEDIISGGTQLPDPEVKPVSPMPKSYFYGGHNNRIPALDNAEMLQSLAWKNGEKTLLAVGNFWENAECFFTLRFPGLDPDTVCTLRTVRSGETFAFTGKEMAQGVLLQCGAMRWNLYVLSAGKPEGKVYTRTEMEALMKERLPEIQKWAAIENERRQNEAAGEKEPDYATLSGVENDGVSVKADKRGFFNVSTSGYSGVVDLSKGATFTSWKIKGEEFCGELPVGSDGFLGVGGFVCEKPYICKSVRKIKDGVEISTEHKVSIKESSTLAGITLRKTISLFPDKIRITTSVVNSTGGSVSFVFRFHSMPASEELLWNHQILPRKRETVHKKPADVQWKGKAVSVNALVSPQDLLEELIFWDGSPFRTRTFEPVFQEVSLTAGLAQEFTMELQIR